MGFLDRSGADLTIDAVLTDVGREKLARNDRSFNVVGYVFGDDEIDYSQFNPSTGSSFIDQQILETPVFEAFSNELLGLNYPLMIITNPNLKYLPTLASDGSGLTIGEEKGLTAGSNIRFFQQTNQNARVVPPEIQDSGFKIELSNELLSIEDEVPSEITSYNTATYILPRDPTLIQSSQGSQITFKVRVQSLSNATWTKLGVGSAGSRTISTKVKATGLTSGLSAEFTVTISEEFSRS